MSRDAYSVRVATARMERAKATASPALKVRPPDLTVLAKRKGGRFPIGDVYQVIKWVGGIIGHGSKEMPAWGSAFKRASNSDAGEVISRIKALTRYLESGQAR